MKGRIWRFEWDTGLFNTEEQAEPYVWQVRLSVTNIISDFCRLTLGVITAETENKATTKLKNEKFENYKEVLMQKP